MTERSADAAGRLPHRDDEELAAAAIAGDPAAIEDLLRSHMRRIHATCRRLCRDPGDAEDAAQEAMMAIVRGIGGFDARSSISSWIYRITTNACIDELRRRRRRPLPDPGDADSEGPDPLVRSRTADPLEAALATEQRQVLLDALVTLPEDYRIAVVLRDVADLDYASIAEVTDVPVGTVRSRIARGRGRLAALLSDDGGRAVASRVPGTESPPATSKRVEDP